MLKHFFGTIIIVIFSCLVSNAQISDSLYKIYLNKNNHDTLRLMALDDFAWLFLYNNPDSAYKLAEIEKKEASKKNLKRYIAQSYNTQGVSFWVRAKYPEAIQCYLKGIKIMNEIGFIKGVASFSNNLALIYKEQGDFKNCIDYNIKSLKASEKIKDKKAIGTSLNNLGVVHYELKDIKESLKYYEKALKIRNEINDKEGILSTMANIGGVLETNHEYKKALTYFIPSLQIAQEINNQFYVATMQSNIAAAYFSIGEIDSSLKYHNLSLQIKKQIDDKAGISTTLTNLSAIERERHNYIIAENYGIEALKIGQEIGDINCIIDASNHLYKIYKIIGDDKKALKMYELYVQMQDSALSKTNQQELIKQSYKYDYEKKEILKDAQYKAKLDMQKAVSTAEAKKQRIILWSVTGGLFMLILFTFFLYNRFKLIKKQKQTIELQKVEVELQKLMLEEKNKEILDSITYAKRLQDAIIPPEKHVIQILPESFVLFKPKDIVSGDFYFIDKIEDKIYFAAVDCTGHGVPGAMVSVVGYNAINRVLKEFGIRKPNEILDKLSELVEESFEKSEHEVKDGMDIALCCYHSKLAILEYAGANNPLYYFHKNELFEIAANKQPIGKFAYKKLFTNHEIKLEKGDSIYLFSDGFADQFGGPKGKKFKYSQLKQILIEIHNKKPELQKSILNDTIEEWKGNFEQVDDICVLGVKVDQ